MGSDRDLGFRYRVTRDGRVLIDRDGAQVAVVAGPRAERFLAQLSSLDGAQVQLALARLTGNYRRGNERQTRGNGAGQRQA